MRRLSFFSLLFLCGSAVAGTNAPTFTEDVAPIVFAKCAVCHRPGQAGPFSLTSYEEVKKRGALIAAVTEARYMPPWHAEPTDYAFANDARLTDEQLETLRQWALQGMPEGDAAKLPPLPEFAEGWELGEPDLVIAMDEAFEVPADGPDLYEYFVLDIPIDQKKWIRALEFQPETRPVVHHILGFLVPGEKLESRGGRGFGGLTNDRNRVLTWAVGGNARVLPEDVGIELEPGVKMILQTHFHPTGKVERERSKIGLYFSREPAPRRSIEVQVPPEFGQISGIKIPAGSDDYVLRESFTIPVGVRAFAAFPHAHYIGKAFELQAHFPSGETRTLLKVTDYDFAWQLLYNFAEPVLIPADTRLETTVRWDNTADNPRNPYNPPQTIPWGPFSEDEMGSIVLDVVAVDPADEQVLLDALEEHKSLAAANFYLSTDGEFFSGRHHPGRYWKRRAKEALKRFDKDGDGRLSESETVAARELLRERGFDEGAQRGDD